MAYSAPQEIFDPEAWLAEFNKPRLHRDQRIKIIEQTLKVCSEFKYTLPNGEQVVFGDFESVSRDAQKTRLYIDAVEHLKRLSNGTNFTTTVEVVNCDCLEEALRLKTEGFNPAVLNMASPRRPGGGYLSGAGAQEENLFRRTNYVQHLADPDKRFDPTRKWNYRLPEFSCVYSTNVQVFRASEAKGYAFLPEPVGMSFLAIAAYPSPKCQGPKGSERLVSEVVEKVKKKIRLMFAVGLDQGHDSLVLSAWGCGAFRNPPRHIASIFKEVLKEPQFRNQYKHISFAIINDHNARGEGNYKPFFDTFNNT
ncbi:hypothetical protein AC249_AIPGENE3144 [Exaiptasia diaphana]|nr:hypothetical protein AC249_AIPGENE3144 [Exaiptasia diaphana]